MGNATVYRNFPDRDALVREVVCSVLDRTAEAAELALAATGDAFGALERFVHTAADERITALCPMVQGAFDQFHPDLVAARVRIEQLVEQLMDRARAAGQLRGDVSVGDLMVAVAQLSRPPALHRLPHPRRVRAPHPSAVPGRTAGPGPVRPAGRGADHGGPPPGLIRRPTD